jgi:hypothetical protein
MENAQEAAVQRSRGQLYGSTHKTLHWAVFGLIAAQYTVGSIMPHIGNNTLDESWVHWHLLIGAVILFFVVVRLAWKMASPVPLETGGPSSLAIASRAVHSRDVVRSDTRDDATRVGRGVLSRLDRMAIRRDPVAGACAKGSALGSYGRRRPRFSRVRTSGVYPAARRGRAVPLFCGARSASCNECSRACREKPTKPA